MPAFCTWKLTYNQSTLVLESLKERQKGLEEHGKLKPEGPQGSDVWIDSKNRIRESRRKSIELAEIIKSIEG